MMEVELDALSGVPNPRWTLSEDQVRTLAARLRKSGLRTDPVEPPGLGYRGFIIHNLDGEPGIASRVRVFRGLVASAETGELVVSHDAGNVEALLCEQARERGYSRLIDQA
jgi:hypothetical protein